MLPLVSIALFYCFKPAEATLENLRAGPAKKPSISRPTSSTEEQKQLSLRRVEESTARAREAIAKAMNSVAPHQGLLLDAYAKGRKESFSKLFNSWNLDPTVADEAVEIIRQRELGRRNALKSYGEGRPAREYLDDVTIEKTGGVIRLNALLGEERATELLKLDAELERSAVREGQKVVKHQSD